MRRRQRANPRSVAFPATVETADDHVPRQAPPVSSRHASVIQLKPEAEQQYRRLHAAVWPAVLKQISRSNITNFSIFLRDGLLFSYFEYVGDDYRADMAAMDGDAETRRWWTLTAPCQQPVTSADPNDWWAPMEEVFHHD